MRHTISRTIKFCFCLLQGDFKTGALAVFREEIQLSDRNASMPHSLGKIRLRLVVGIDGLL